MKHLSLSLLFRWVGPILSVALILSPVAASQAASTTAVGQTVAYITPSLAVPFWRWTADGVQEAAARVGWHVLVFDSKNDGSIQLANARTAITRGVKAIIISPTNSSTTPAVLNVAKAAHIPVVICFIGTTSGSYLSYLTSTDFGGAYASARILAQALKKHGWRKGPVGMVTIPLSRINGQLRTAGVRKAMAEAGIPIVEYLQFQTDTILEDSHLVRDIMTAHPNIHGFFCESDDCTLAAVAFLRQTHELNSHVYVAGFDASQQTIKYIRQGLVLAAAVQQPVRVGRLSFQFAYQYLVSHKRPKHFVQVKTILVTTKNVKKTSQELIDNAYPR